MVSKPIGHGPASNSGILRTAKGTKRDSNKNRWDLIRSTKCRSEKTCFLWEQNGKTVPSPRFTDEPALNKICSISRDPLFDLLVSQLQQGYSVDLDHLRVRATTRKHDGNLPDTLIA